MYRKTDVSFQRYSLNDGHAVLQYMHAVLQYMHAVHEVCIIILSNQKLNHLTLKIEELDLTLICWLLINFLYVLDR